MTEGPNGVEAIKIASDGDDEDFWCMTLEASGTAEVGLRRGCIARTPQLSTAVREQHCDAVTDTFVTLDTAADGHCGPTWFGDGCAMGPDAGPTLRDAQRQAIDFEGVAKVPMVVHTEGGTQLLKASMRLGKTMSKPILSMLGVMDKGADFWLSSKTGMIMYPGGDLTQPIQLERKNNTLGFNVKRFTTTAAARDFANGVEAVGVEDEDYEKYSASRSSSGPKPETEALATLAPPLSVPEPTPEEAAVAMRTAPVIQPWSRIVDMHARLRELGAPIYGTKDEVWSRLSKAEAKYAAHKTRLEEMEKRQEAVQAEQPTLRRDW